MILASGEWQHIATIDHDDEACFFTFEKFLDHDACTGVAKTVIRQHHIDGLMRFIKRHRNHHPFTCGKAVRLDDDRSTLLINILMRGCDVCEGLRIGCRYAVTQHERFREIFRRLKLRCALSRAKDF